MSRQGVPRVGPGDHDLQWYDQWLVTAADARRTYRDWIRLLLADAAKFEACALAELDPDRRVRLLFVADRCRAEAARAGRVAAAGGHLSPVRTSRPWIHTQSSPDAS